MAPPPPPPAAIAAPVTAPDPADPKTDTADASASSGPEKDATAPVGDKVGKQPIPLKKPTPLPSPKQPQAKSWEGSTEIKATKDPHVLALETKLQAYFAAEKKRVVFSAKRAALPTTVGLRFDSILKKQQGALTDLLLTANRPLIYESGQTVLQRLSETKQAVPFMEPALKKQASASAARIQETTRLALVEAMDYGIAKNETVDELAARIEDVYDGDMQGWRARQIAQTEVTRTTNYGMYAAAFSLGAPVQKTWVTVGDERVRPSHQEVAGMVLNLDESFGVAGENMLYPGDLESGATASNVINCRCSIDYLLAGKAGGVPEEKDNPNHGPNGQFTFGSGGAGGGAGALAKAPKKDDPAYNTAVSDAKDERHLLSTLQGQGNEWKDSLPETQQEAVDVYVTEASKEINAVYRKGIDSIYADDAHQLSSALAQATLGQATTAYRGMASKTYTAEFFKNNVGGVLEDKGFVSTSVSQSIAEGFIPFTPNQEGVLMHIRVPSGYHAAFLGTNSSHSDEQELLLQQGSHFIIRSVETTSYGRTVVHADAFLPGAVKSQSLPEKGASSENRYIWNDDDILFHPAEQKTVFFDEDGDTAHKIDAILLHPTKALQPLSYQAFRAQVETKFDPAHDADGQFGTTGNGAGGGAGGTFPTKKEFVMATLDPFVSGGRNSAYSTVINGTKYFAKNVDEIGSKDAELAASQMAQDVGMGDLAMPLQIMGNGGNKYVVSPWTDMAQFADMTKEDRVAAVQKMSVEDYTKFSTYQYLMNDPDRHTGNFLIDPATGKTKIIDMGQAFSDTTESVLNRSALNNARANYGDIPATKLDPVTMKNMVKGTKNFSKHMAGMPQAKIDAMQQRIELVRYLSTLKSVRANDLM
jgi:hypothetical protein